MALNKDPAKRINVNKINVASEAILMNPKLMVGFSFASDAFMQIIVI